MAKTRFLAGFRSFWETVKNPWLRIAMPGYAITRFFLQTTLPDYFLPDREPGYKSIGVSR
jgi:hypothetical protein